MGTRKFEEVGGGGGMISPFSSPGWERHLPSPCCSVSPGQVTLFWPRACFLMGAVSQLFCFTPELLQVWPLEQRQKQHGELVRNADSRPPQTGIVNISGGGPRNLCFISPPLMGL